MFTSTHLAKHQQLLIANSGHHDCTVCSETINLAAEVKLETSLQFDRILSTDVLIKDPLTVAVCPNPECSGTSHLLCLSSAFLSSSDSSTTLPSSSSSTIIPRGGACPSCGEYTLWGDVIRGCYRRRAHGATVIGEDDDDEVAAKDVDDEASPASGAGSSLSDSDDAEDLVKVAKKRGRPPKAKPSSARKLTSTGPPAKSTKTLPPKGAARKTKAKVRSFSLAFLHPLLFPLTVVRSCH